MTIDQTRINRFFERTLTKVAKRARTIARPQVPSVTLRKAMDILVNTEAREAYVIIPHYWALYVHDGTRAIWHRPTSRGKRYFIYFGNKKDDPRITGGRPERLADLRSLTQSEYNKGLRKNRVRRKQGRKPYMYVMKRIKTPTPKPGAQFFNTSVGMTGFEQQAALIIADQFVRLAKSRDVLIGDDMEVVLRLG